MKNPSVELWVSSAVPSMRDGTNLLLADLEPDDTLSLSLPDFDEDQVLTVTCVDPVSGLYSVSRRGPGYPQPEANEWSLGTQLTSMERAGQVAGILLLPSVVGDTLYGAARCPRDGEERFGAISLAYDRLKQVHSVDITMPDAPYRSVQRLQVTQTAGTNKLI